MAVHKFVVEDEPKKSSEATKSVKKTTEKGVKKPKAPREPRKLTKPFRALGGYFKGSWQELRQVHWPNRKQTWALTLAVMLFSLFLGVLIFLLDLAFTYLFKEIIL